VQTAAEQRSHLLGGHRVADGQAVDPAQAGTDRRPRRLTAFGVVRRQPGMTFLGRIQRRDLPGQVVISGSRCELCGCSSSQPPKDYMPPERSRPSSFWRAPGVCVAHRILKSRGYVKRFEIVGYDRSRRRNG
jgi:hypothetical protein